eukprot:432300_1
MSVFWIIYCLVFILKYYPLFCSANNVNCTDKFVCEKSGICIDQSTVCDDIPDCPDQEDEIYCKVCISDPYKSIFDGRFEYIHTNGVGAMVYKHIHNVSYLCPYNSGYVITNYCKFANEPVNSTLDLNYQITCIVADDNKSHFTVGDCLYWEQLESNGNTKLAEVRMDIGCNGCDYTCMSSGLCINQSLLCDGSPDCPQNDDEIFCVICIKNNDFRQDLPRIRGTYLFYKFDNVNKGIIYYSGIDYFYPIIESHDDGYYIEYAVSTNYTEIKYPLAKGVIAYTNETIPYLIIRPWYIISWMIMEPSRYLYVPVNASVDVCSTNTTIQDLVNTRNDHDWKHVPDWTDCEHNSIRFYVSSNGSDVENCGTEMRPCGTLHYTLIYVYVVSIKMDCFESCTIIIRGQNAESILWYIETEHYNPCYALVTVPVNDKGDLTLNSITFEFDPQFISSKEDWFPTSGHYTLCDYQQPSFIQSPNLFDGSFFSVSHAYPLRNGIFDFTVSINNCVINDWIVYDNLAPNSLAYFAADLSSAGQLRIKYIFNNLIFHDNDVNTLITAAQIEINNSSFYNNTFRHNEADYDYCTYIIYSPEEQVSRQSIMIRGTQINNVTIMGYTAFISIVQAKYVSELQVHIYDNLFNHIFSEKSAIIKISNHYNVPSNNIIIQNISFLNVSGNIIAAFGRQNGLFRIANLYITTSKMTSAANLDVE